MVDKQALTKLVAGELIACMGSTPVGVQFEIVPNDELLFSLELFVPELLRAKYSEWDRESIDGFLVESAVRTGVASVTMMGLCILISDQSTTPFFLDLLLVLDGSDVEVRRLCVGIPGGGALGISGPVVGSAGSKQMSPSLVRGVAEDDWVFCVG